MAPGALITKGSLPLPAFTKFARLAAPVETVESGATAAVTDEVRSFDAVVIGHTNSLDATGSTVGNAGKGLDPRLASVPAPTKTRSDPNASNATPRRLRIVNGCLG